MLRKQSSQVFHQREGKGGDGGEREYVPGRVMMERESESDGRVTI
jgi:hypothetical protein